MRYLRHYQARFLAWRVRRWLEKKENLYDWCRENDNHYYYTNRLGDLCHRDWWSQNSDIMHKGEVLVASPVDVKGFIEGYDKLERQLVTLVSKIDARVV